MTHRERMQARFDSKLVRLKVKIDADLQNRLNVGFDSKLVRLKGGRRSGVKMNRTRFDSKLVRLKVDGAVRHWRAAYVSIPNWFD